MSSQDKYIISEFYAFVPDKKVIKEAEEKGTPITMTGILQKANTQNRNGRVYPFNILKREADKYMELVKERRAMGELDHPESAVVSLSNVSHIVTEMWWEDETLKGKVEIVDSPSGNILKGLIRSGVMLGISSRGVGSVKQQSGKDVVQEDFELIAFDFVSSPSTPGAYLFKEGRQWGLTRLTDSSAKILTPKEVDYMHGKDKFSGIINLSKDNFWKIK
jgi:hypothetical protein